jgi:hypothetical protein
MPHYMAFSGYYAYLQLIHQSQQRPTHLPGRIAANRRIVLAPLS